MNKNGTPLDAPPPPETRPASDLREDYRRARYANRLRAEQLQSHLLESVFPGYGEMWGQAVDPRGRYPGEADGFHMAGFGQATDPQSRKRGAPYYAFRNYEELRGIWAVSRCLDYENELMAGLLRGLSGYIVHTGFNSRAVARKGVDEHKAAAKVTAAQRELDDFDNESMWPELEAEILVRSIVDGEARWRHFDGDDILQVRRIEPELIMNPHGLADGEERDGTRWTYGVGCDPKDHEREEGFGINCTGAVADWEFVPAGECESIKRNVPRNVARGLSDFFCGVGDVAGEARKLLEYMRKGATVLAAIAWFEKHKTATKGEVEAAHDALKTLSLARTNPDGGTSTVRYRRMLPGAIVGTDDQKDIQPPPLAQNTPHFSEIARLARMSLAVRWNAPESLLGDASNGTFASLGIAESPFVRTGEMEQWKYARRFRRTKIRVLKHAIAQGRLDDDTLAYVDVEVVPPSMIVRNRLDEANVTSRKIMDGYKSPQQAAQEDGEDWERIQKDVKAAQEAGWVMPGTVPAPPVGAPGAVMPGMFEGQKADPFAWLREAEPTPLYVPAPAPVVESEKPALPPPRVIGEHITRDAAGFITGREFVYEDAVRECGGEGGKPGPCPSGGGKAAGGGGGGGGDSGGGDAPAPKKAGRQRKTSDVYEGTTNGSTTYADIDDHTEGLKTKSMGEVQAAAREADITPTSKDTKASLIKRISGSMKDRLSKAGRTAYGSEGLPAPRP